ncbi:MAG: hypothetical protein CL624_02555 [Arcobacter sp.]|nr:hypothetical protein [Arcobacter sp.]|tara:strand:- start:1328 stop:1957 length:630 start_codon:yes stop_codon:yes gene_type:complete
MYQNENNFNLIFKHLQKLPKNKKRHLISIVGTPGSGKSTFSNELLKYLTKKDYKCEVIAMDGFHLDNRILESKNLLSRKGSYETFDINGFLSLIKRLQKEGNILAPLFNREQDISIAAAVEIKNDLDFIIIEGNYLLLNRPTWCKLKEYWDLSIMLDIDIKEIEKRLLKRWLYYGYTKDEALKKIKNNDILNSKEIIENSLKADIVIKN